MLEALPPPRPPGWSVLDGDGAGQGARSDRAGLTVHGRTVSDDGKLSQKERRDRRREERESQLPDQPVQRRPRLLDHLLATRAWADGAGFSADALALLDLAVTEVRNGGAEVRLRAVLAAMRQQGAQGTEEQRAALAALEQGRRELEEEKRQFAEHMHTEREALEAAENDFDQFIRSKGYYPAEESMLAVVTDAKHAERAVFQRWMDECADLGPSKGPTEFRALYESYAAWTQRRDEFRYSYKKFGEYLNFRDIGDDPGHGAARRRIGIALKVRTP